MVRGRWIGYLEESQSCSFGKLVPSGFQCQEGVEWEGLLGAGTWTGTEPQCVGPGDTDQDRTALRTLHLTWTSISAGCRCCGRRGRCRAHAGQAARLVPWWAALSTVGKLEKGLAAK